MTEASSGRQRHRRLRFERQGRERASPATDRAEGAEPAPTGPTNLGPLFDQAVADAVARQQPPGQDPVYDLVREAFDVDHYLLQLVGERKAPKVDVVRQFLNQGAAARFSPDINFSMEAYLKRHPERRDGDVHPFVAWLTEGRAAGEIADPTMGIDRLAEVLGTTPHDVASQMAASRSDVQHRLRHGKLGEMFAKAVEVEPLIGEVWTETANPRMMPIPWLMVADQAVALAALQSAAGNARAEMVMVVEDPDCPLAARLIEALAAEVGEQGLLVLVTGDACEAVSPMPAGVRVVRFSEAGGRLGPVISQHVLVEFLRSLWADAIVGIGSGLFHESLTPYGRALSDTERIFLGFPALETGIFGQETGTATRYFYRQLEVVEGVFTPDVEVASRLVHDYQLPKDLAGKIYSLEGEAALGDGIARLFGREPDGRA